jgi:hypothetical protein
VASEPPLGYPAPCEFSSQDIIPTIATATTFEDSVQEEMATLLLSTPVVGFIHFASIIVNTTAKRKRKEATTLQNSIKKRTTT